MKIVIFEGKEDVLVAEAICADSGIVDLKFEEIQGRDNLERYLRELPKRSDFTRGEVDSLCVVLDAEADGAAAWQKLQNAVSNGFGVQLDVPGEFGGTKPRIAGLIVPAADGHGMLEDLCLEAVNDQPSYGCLLDYFKCLAQKTAVKEYHAKARFRAWMASQKEYVLSMGLAARKGYIPWQKPCFDPLRDFLRNA